MLSLDKANGIVKKAFPKGKINLSIDYNNLYIFKYLTTFLVKKAWTHFSRSIKKPESLEISQLLQMETLPKLLNYFLKCNRNVKFRRR